MGDDRRDDPDEPSGRYSLLDWRANGYRGPPPWRRGYQPLLLVISLALVAILLVVPQVAGSRLP